MASVAGASKVTLLCESEGFTLTREDNRWRLTLADGRQWLPRLLAGADGAQSRVRAQAGIGKWLAVSSVLPVSHGKNRGSTARHHVAAFLSVWATGILPLYGQHGSLVWYDKPARIKQLSALPNAQLHKAISQAFPARLGEFEVLDKGAFALVRRHAQQYVLPGLALLGMRRTPLIRWQGRASIWALKMCKPCWRYWTVRSATKKRLALWRCCAVMSVGVDRITY